jgi:hypothetical protein
MDITMKWNKRKAKFIHKYKGWYVDQNVEEREHIVEVHGFFQYAESHGDGLMDAEPIAIIEMADGRVFEVPPTSLTFLKEDD